MFEMIAIASVVLLSIGFVGLVLSTSGTLALLHVHRACVMPMWHSTAMTGRVFVAQLLAFRANPSLRGFELLARWFLVGAMSLALLLRVNLLFVNLLHSHFAKGCGVLYIALCVFELFSREFQPSQAAVRRLLSYGRPWVVWPLAVTIGLSVAFYWLGCEEDERLAPGCTLLRGGSALFQLTSQAIRADVELFKGMAASFCYTFGCK